MVRQYRVIYIYHNDKYHDGNYIFIKFNRQICITVYHCICKNLYCPLFSYVTVALHAQIFPNHSYFVRLIITNSSQSYSLSIFISSCLVVINGIVSVITVSCHGLSPQIVSCFLFVFNHGLFLLPISERNMPKWLTC